MGELKYLANERDKIATDEGLIRKTNPSEDEGQYGPKNLC